MASTRREGSGLDILLVWFQFDHSIAGKNIRFGLVEDSHILFITKAKRWQARKPAVSLAQVCQIAHLAILKLMRLKLHQSEK